MVLRDLDTATEMLARVERVVLNPDESERATAALQNAAELAAALK
jgi:hypothetical protein